MAAVSLPPLDLGRLRGHHSVDQSAENYGPATLGILQEEASESDLATARSAYFSDSLASPDPPSPTSARDAAQLLRGGAGAAIARAAHATVAFERPFNCADPLGAFEAIKTRH